MIKCYLGYYRFSEDLDFTWKWQEEFTEKKKSQVVKYIEKVLEQTGMMLEGIADRRNLDFKWDKADRNYVTLSNGGRMTTFYIHYHSIILKRRVNLKVQINFVE